MIPSGVDTLDLCQSITTLNSEWKRDSPHNDVVTAVAIAWKTIFRWYTLCITIAGRITHTIYVRSLQRIFGAANFTAVPNTIAS